MDERIEITDQASARAWLETQDHQTQVWFAARCALRGLPGLGQYNTATLSGLAFTSLRAVLISAAAATCPAAEMMVLSDSARSAFSAARSADSAAFSATAFDSVSPGNWALLWSDVGQPDGLKAGWDALKAQWAADDADWSFWIEWYEAILEGNPLPWELTHRIALNVTKEDWDAGPQRVAEHIAEIRRDFDTPPLDQDALHSHVQQLAQSPVLHADIAESAGLQIETAIQAFKNEAPANQLPDGLAAFETLAPAFRSISATLSAPAGTAPDTAALQAEINHLHSVIKQLRTDLQEARSRLSEARLTAPEAQQLRTFGEKAATFLTCVVTTGIIGSGIANFFGVSVEDQTYETLKNALQGLSAEMENAQPAPEAPTLPEATEV